MSDGKPKKNQAKWHRATSRYWRRPDQHHVVTEGGGGIDQHLCHVVIVVKEEGAQIHIVGEEAINLHHWRWPDLRSMAPDVVEKTTSFARRGDMHGQQGDAVTEPPREGVRRQDQLEQFSAKRIHNQYT
jgi:hypothetical protein